MDSHSTQVIARLAAWTFLPDLITRGILSWFCTPALRAKPSTYRRVLAAVIGAYLLYNIYQASFSTPPNYYQILGVPVDATDNELKLAFRTFARKNHPDRAGAQAAKVFVEVRDAYDGLRHPVRRFAYDRFGPDVLSEDACGSQRECVNTGLLGSIGFYLGSSFFMGVSWLFGARDSGSFWRWLLFLGLFITELSFVLTPTPNMLLQLLFPHRVPYQHVQYLHQLFLSVTIAIQRIYPALLPDLVDANELSADIDPEMLKTAAANIALLTKSVELESTCMSLNELRIVHVATNKHPRRADFPTASMAPDVVSRLLATAEKIIMERIIQSHPVLQTEWDASVARMHAQDDEDKEVELSAGSGDDNGAQLPSPPGSDHVASPTAKSPVRLDRTKFDDLKIQSSLDPNTSSAPGVALRRRSGSV